jgi:hypothetical protein
VSGGLLLLLILSAVFVCSALAAAAWSVILARRVRDGWQPEWFKGTHEEFVARYRKRAALVGPLFLALGAFFAVVGIEANNGRGTPLLTASLAVGFVALGGVTLWCRRVVSASR